MNNFLVFSESKFGMKLTTEKGPMAWISDMIQLVLKKELMWDVLETELDDVSSSLVKSKEIIKILIHELKMTQRFQCRCTNNDENIGNAVESTNKVESMVETKDDLSKGTLEIPNNVHVINFDKEELLESKTTIKHLKGHAENISILNHAFEEEGINFDACDSEDDPIENEPPNSNVMHDEEVDEDDEANKYLATEAVPRNGTGGNNETSVGPPITTIETVEHERAKNHPNVQKEIKREHDLMSEDPLRIGNGTKGSSKNRHECKTCFKTFPTPSKLERHENVHSGIKMFQCGSCNKRFNQAHHLKSHLSRSKHSSQFTTKKYVCQICSKSFITRFKLERHESVHTGKKIFQCETCKKRFIQAGHLNEHLNKTGHKTEKPYACEVCSERFFAASELKNHETSLDHSRKIIVVKGQLSQIIEHFSQMSNPTKQDLTENL